MLPDEFKRRN